MVMILSSYNYPIRSVGINAILHSSIKNVPEKAKKSREIDEVQTFPKVNKVKTENSEFSGKTKSQEIYKFSKTEN